MCEYNSDSLAMYRNVLLKYEFFIYSLGGSWEIRSQLRCLAS